MIRYDSKNIIVGEIKQLLHSSNLPQYKVLTKGTKVFKGIYYLYQNKILRANKDDFNFVEYNNANFDFVANFSEGKYILNVSKNLELKNNYYDWITHEYLGDYLRFKRDYYGVDLMSMYNCFNGRIANWLDIDYPNYSFKSSDSNYVIYEVQAKFDKKYTIAIDCASQIEIIAGLYSGENQKTSVLDYSTKEELIEKLYNATYFKYCGTRFSFPFIYDKLCNTSELGKEFYDNESILKLFIKVPKGNKSSLVVLEGEYGSYTNRYFNEKSVMSKQSSTIINMNKLDDIDDKIYKSMPQLLLMNNKVSYPFADRLVEYICNNVIIPTDTMNLKKLQKALLRDKLITSYTSGYKFTDDIRVKLYYKALLERVLDNHYDILGYVDKEIEDKVIVDFDYDGMEG